MQIMLDMKFRGAYKGPYQSVRASASLESTMNKNINQAPAEESVSTPVNVMVTLEGEEAARFLAYKKRKYLKANAEAGRQLMMERLDEVEAAPA